jgi:transposase
MDAALPDSLSLRLEHVRVSAEGVTLVTVTSLPFGRCPRCQSPSMQVHSRYKRVLTDLPWLGIATRVQVQARRFRCQQAACPQRIFCER